MQHGIIYHKNIKQGMFVLMLNEQNFIVFESYDITVFNIGDVLFGEFNECGMASIIHTSTLKSYRILIQNIGLDSTMALQKADVDQ